MTAPAPLGNYSAGSVSADRQRWIQGQGANPRPGPLVRPIAGMPRSSILAELYDLMDVWRREGSRRVQHCGYTRSAAAVKISHAPGTADGRQPLPHYVGVQHCGLAWECACCSAKIKRERTKEVNQLLEWHAGRWGHGTIVFLSLTVRHGMGDDLKALRAGVADAYRRVQSGRAWQDMKRRLGFVGSVRTLEVTHGWENGWHPHLHVVLLFQRAVDQRALAEFLSDRWQWAVQQTLGDEFIPDSVHGCDVSVCRGPQDIGQYLFKLGLELVSPNTKHGHGLHRTPLQILSDYAATGDYRDAKLYRAYAQGMKGARQLTWTHGLKRAAGILEQTDEQLAAAEQAQARDVAMLAASEWDSVRKVPGARATLLEIAERSGAEGVFAAIDVYLGRPRTGPRPYNELLLESEMQLAICYSPKRIYLR